MGILGGVKDSLSGSSDSSEFESSDYDSSFSSDKTNPQSSPLDDGPQDQAGAADPGDQGPQRGQGGRPDQDSQLNPPGGGGQPGAGNQPSQGPQGGRGGTPNAQAGRPQEGSSEPQVSSQTRDKMRDAGFDMDNDRGGRESRQQPDPRGGRPGRQESVASRRDDLDEIKSQNEQIIDLLKRINDSLQGGGSPSRERSRHGGRR